MLHKLLSKIQDKFDLMARTVDELVKAKVKALPDLTEVVLLHPIDERAIVHVVLTLKHCDT